MGRAEGVPGYSDGIATDSHRVPFTEQYIAFQRKVFDHALRLVQSSTLKGKVTEARRIVNENGIHENGIQSSVFDCGVDRISESLYI
jgi:hypothetical protein